MSKAYDARNISPNVCTERAEYFFVYISSSAYGGIVYYVVGFDSNSVFCADNTSRVRLLEKPRNDTFLQLLTRGRKILPIFFTELLSILI